MPGIVEFPKLVQDALTQYGDLFANECQRRHLAEYLTGLIVAERKTVLGIHGEFADTTDQSCLNRFLTSADWGVEEAEGFIKLFGMSSTLWAQVNGADRDA